MAKRKPKPPEAAPPPKPRRWWRRVFAVLVTLGIALALLFGLGWLGEFARHQLGPQERYRVSFAEIECEAPPGRDRATFLSEVRYASNFPETFQILDKDRDAKLRAAFLAHPWVEAVDSVEVEAPRTIRLRLRFRTPALAVRLRTGRVRLVDGNGVLLPHTPQPEGLPELTTPLSEPDVAAGQSWPDEAVVRALELVKTYGVVRVEKTTTGWRLTESNGNILNVGG